MLATCWPETSPAQPEVPAPQTKRGGDEASKLRFRFYLYDRNKDGWDDLWMTTYPRIDQSRPDSDEDDDGISNYEEMIAFSNPYDRSMRRIPTKEELLQAEREAGKVRRATDEVKMQGFFKALRNNGAANEPSQETKPKIEKQPTPSAPEGSEDTSKNCEQEYSFMDVANCSEPPETPLPKIIALERFENGNFILAWRGTPTQLYDVEWSRDLINWMPGAHALPTVDGIGTWGQNCREKARFFRVSPSPGLPPTTPSSLDGGDGITTFGAVLNFLNNGKTARVDVNLPGNIDPSLVKLYIDGKFYDYCHGSDGVYTCHVRSENLPSGIRLAHAIIEANFDTTPEGNEAILVSAGAMRTAEVPFEIQENWGFTGFRATEEEINDGTILSPTSTTLSVEIPYSQINNQPVNEFEHELVISDEFGNTVRAWQGTSPGPGPVDLSFVWDGTTDSGTAAPPGTYSALFSITTPFDISTQQPISIRHGEMALKALAIYETLGEIDGIDEIEEYQPSWADELQSSGGLDLPAGDGRHWGPWRPLGGGPAAICGAMQRGLGGRGTKWKFTFWGTNNNNSDAEPWRTTKSRPATEFYTGNPLNDYDIGFLIGHGVASAGGPYVDKAGNHLNAPPQHYFPLVSNPDTGSTVWLKSGEMAERFGDEGRLKWMFVMTCNYLRVGEHNGGTHEIYSPMKASNSLPFGPNLHVLCAYTTSIDLEGALGTALSDGLLQNAAERMTVLDAWKYAWDQSVNKNNGRNARSVFWPECAGDTILGVPHVNVTTPSAHQSQAELQVADSKEFP